jgi:FKBP-type peptidyl-prolyl cis-trans isomerase FkpA
MFPKKSTLLIGSCIALGFALTSCSNSPYEGFEATDSGLYYAFYKQNESGKTPELKDILYTHMSLSVKRESGDSLLFDSKSFPDYPESIKFIQLSEPMFKGDIMEGLKMMHIGDSASFIVSADSFFLKANKMEQMPPGIASGSFLQFQIGLVDIKSEQETMAKLEELRTKMQVQNQADADRRMKEEPEVIQEYITRKGIKEKPTASGMYYIETEKGNGPKVKKGQLVTMQYTGYLINGKKFDSSFDHGQPFSFTLGKGEVIGGWEEGVSMMNVGSSATFIIPSVLGYGSNGSGPIPPFAPLIFEVQLMKAE